MDLSRRSFLALAAILAARCRTQTPEAADSSGGASEDAGRRDDAEVRRDDVASSDAGSVERYLSLGDSFTAGTGSLPSESFASRLVARWRDAGVRVDARNPAVNGYTTADVLEREVPLLAVFLPTFVTLAIGANNIVRRGTAETYRADVRRILRAARDAGVAAADIMALPQPEWPRSPTGREFGDSAQLLDRVREFNTILRDETRAIGGQWLDLTALMTAQADAGSWASDGLHPSALAYDQWAEAIFRARPTVRAS